jgi:hypothetical protein
MTRTTHQSRRRLLKTVAAGGGMFASSRMLPEKWASPVVDSILLPVHARSTMMYVPAAGGASQATSGLETGNRFVQILNKLIPVAHARTEDRVDVCVTPNADGTKADITVFDIVTGSNGCTGDPVSIIIRTANNVNVPSTGNALSDSGEECNGGASNDNLLERLGIMRSAYAADFTVDISSVTNGAAGSVNLGGRIWNFSIPPGGCLTPLCCVSE